MSNQVQQQIRENAMEFQDFLKDLQSWEQTVKEKDRQLKGQRGGEGASTSSSKVDAPPVRGRVKASVSAPAAAAAPSVTNTPAFKAKEDPRKGTVSAAAHTYDYFRDKWDKFDVDAALDEVDRAEEVKKQEGSERKAPQPAAKPAPKPARPVPIPARPVPGATTANGVQAKTPALPATSVPDSLSSDLLRRHLPLADPAAEKDRGNELFREGKYAEAVDAYSRSIGLQPTAIAFANRAMASLKLKRYEEAEADCTEALLLDDRYVKAYSRRGSARRELKKYLAAVQDFEFALRLEPESKELKRQYMEARSLCEKDARLKPAATQQIPVQVVEKLPPVMSPSPATSAASASRLGAERAGSQSAQGEDRAGNQGHVSGADVRVAASDGASAPAATTAGAPGVAGHTGGKQASAAATPVAASQAPLPPPPLRGPSAATALAAQSILVEKMAATASSAGAAVRTHTELLTLWKTFEGSPERQANILRGLDPAALPKIFKDSLTPQFIIHILQNLARCFLLMEAAFAADVAEGLSQCARFSMIVRCITKKQKEEMHPFWESATASEDEALRKRFTELRLKYNA